MNLFPLYLTVKVSITATMFTASVGLVLAWILAKKEFFGKTVIDVLIMQPLVIPPTVLGYYLLSTFGAGSPIGGFFENVLGLQIVFTWKGAVLASLVSSLPLFVKPAKAAIEGVGNEIMVAGNIPGRTQTLPIAIYDAVQSGDDYTANLLVGIITLFSFLVLYIAERFSKGRF